MLETPEELINHGDILIDMIKVEKELPSLDDI